MPTRVPRPPRPSASLSRALFSASLGRPRDPRPSVSSRLLSQARHASYQHTHEGVHMSAVTFSPHDCFPVQSYDTDTFHHVDLRHFPSGAVVDTLPQGYRPRPTETLPVMDYRATDGLFAYTLHHDFHSDLHGLEHAILLVRFPHNGRGRRSVAGAPRNSVVHALSLAPAGHSVAAAETGATCVYAAREGASRLVLSVSLAHPDYAPGYVTRFFAQDQLMSGTRAGNVYRWDLRTRGHAPVWTAMAATRKGRVHDMRVSADATEVYVSLSGERNSNLTVWDMRMSGASAEPHRVFSRWGRWGDSVAFDVDETGTGGLLAAGGSDSKVSLWDCKRGGEPLEQISFGTEHPQRVKLLGWDGKGKSLKPGLLVETEIQVYVFEIGERWDHR